VPGSGDRGVSDDGPVRDGQSGGGDISAAQLAAELVSVDGARPTDLKTTAKSSTPKRPERDR
jgi:hypothetical protein